MSDKKWYSLRFHFQECRKTIRRPPTNIVQIAYRKHEGYLSIVNHLYAKKEDVLKFNFGKYFMVYDSKNLNNRTYRLSDINFEDKKDYEYHERYHFDITFFANAKAKSD